MDGVQLLSAAIALCLFSFMWIAGLTMASVSHFGWPFAQKVLGLRREQTRRHGVKKEKCD